MTGKSPHIEPETLQAFLENGLDVRHRARVEAHIAGCPSCSAELDAWRAVFEELADLPTLVPSPAFRSRVLAELPRPALPAAAGAGARPPSLPSRLRAAFTSVAGSIGHLSPSRAQDFVEGLLTGRGRARVEAHVQACSRCAKDVAEWRTILGDLDRLPMARPDARFADRVMVTFRERSARAPAPARIPTSSAAPGMLDRIRAAGTALVPSTRRGRALAGGLAAAPALGFFGILAAVVAHPLLTPLDLAAYLMWRSSDAVAALFDWAVAYALGSPLLVQAGAAIQPVFSSATTAISLFAMLWLTTLAAAWVLYRNVVAPSLEARSHARASS